MPAPPAPSAPQPSQSRVAQLRDLQKRLAQIESRSRVGPGGRAADDVISNVQSGHAAPAGQSGHGNASDGVAMPPRFSVNDSVLGAEESLMSASDAESLARSIVLRQLTAAPKSRAQLAAAMAKHEVPAVVADAILDRFEAVGLVDDVALAEMLVRTRHNERGLTGPALAAELRRRGLSDEVAAQAMDQITQDDEFERALALARRKLASTTNLDREVRRRRTYAHLARKGYSPSVARQALDQVLGAS